LRLLPDGTASGPTQERKETFEAFLRSRRYRNAPVTVDNADHMFNDILNEARAQNDVKLAEQAKREYLQFAQGEFAYFEEASRKLFWREKNSLVFSRSVATGSCRSTKLLPILPTQLQIDSWVRQGSPGLTEWRVFFGEKADYEHDPDPPDWVMKRFREIRRAAAGQ